MTQCPDVDGLLSGQARVSEHAGACAACSAVMSLVSLREERAATRGDACVEAEVALALEAEGLLGSEQDAALREHLASCAECNEVAVRVLASAARLDREVVDAEDQSPGTRLGAVRQSPWGLGLGLAAAVATAAALGALWMREAQSGAVRALPESPRAGAEAPSPGAERRASGAELSAPAELGSGREVGPLAPRPVERPAPTVIDPWATPSVAPQTPLPPPSAGTSGSGYLTLLCVPVCDSVWVRGKNLGPSPVVRVALAPGRVNVELRRGATRKHVSILVVAGQTIARRVNMDNPAELVDPWR